ncbi:TRAP transporter substrate-binding protein DctP [Microbulbifer sp. S227A]|uniref:TRAP transporter substrate-binding protein DctP n=1 Tax=Microbulbifer sp. S227A TaxID=3415131 RepID=UPI003C7A3DE4
MTTFTRTMKLALLTALAGAAQAADCSIALAPVLTEDTPNARAAMVFKDEVEQNSDGRIEINIRPAAQLGGDVEIIEQTQMGLVHIAIPPTGNLANFNEQMYLFDLPFLLSDDAAMIVGRDAARAFTSEDEAKIIDRIKGEITIQELSPEGRAAFVVASQPIYADFRDKVTPALMDKALALAKGE